MPTSTTNFGLSKPLVNDATDQDLWGGYLNTDLDSLDTLLLTCLNWTVSSQTSTITVTIPTSGSTTTGSARKLFLCNATSGAFAANLPAASTATNMVVSFKKTDSTANAITITPNGSDKIDGASSFALSAQYDWLTLVCDGTGWNVMSKVPPAATIPVLHHQEFTTTGSNTFTAPANTVASTVFKFILTGGGGAGGGAAAGQYGAGAGAGATAIYFVSGLTANTGYSITVGAGAVGASGTGATGTATTLTIGAVTVTANGGVGGGANATLTSPGTGGTATNGSINISGGDGTIGASQSTHSFSGNGGASFWGGGAPGSNSGAGASAQPYGAGGAGAASGFNGGSGKQGIVTVEWVA